MQLMPKVTNTDINWSFLNSLPLSFQINLEPEVLGRISLKYAMQTSCTVLLFNGTVIRYEVNKQINVSTCLLPLEVVGSGLMESMAYPAKGTFGISKCMGCGYNLLGRN